MQSSVPGTCTELFVCWCVSHAHSFKLAFDFDWLASIQTAHRGLAGKSEAPPSASSPVSASSANPTSRKQGQGDGEEEEKEEEGDERENEEEEEEDNDEEDQPSSPDSGSSMEWRCRECKTRYTERDDYIDHMKNEHGTVNTPTHYLLFTLFVYLLIPHITT